MRTIVDLRSEQIESLAVLCKKEHLSRAELIRRAVEKFLSAQSPGKDLEHVAFGIWKNKVRDARKWGDQSRSEWDRS